MNIIGIDEIKRTDTLLHYIRKYEGQLSYYTNPTYKNKQKIRFTLEHDAAGRIVVDVDFMGTIDYPLIPAKRKVKEYILKLDKQGELR
ncbi:MAG: hypothetical protein JXR63_07740 [Spirochaetales bacterium]|nr:hypothetical protein [Spirochaetales bacterium]